MSKADLSGAKSETTGHGMKRIWFLVLGILLMSAAVTGCQSMGLQEAREGSLHPGALVGAKERPMSPRDGTDLSATEGASQRDADRNARILAEMDARDAGFNRRLESVLGQGRGPQMPGRVSTDGTRQAIRGETTKVSFDFFDADLADVVRLFMELLKENYALDSKVAGKVALHVDGEMSRDEIWELFRGVLRMQGAAVMLDNGIWRILPLSEVPTSIDEAGIVFDGTEGVRARGQSVQVFKLDFLPVAEFSNIIKPYLSPGSMVYGHEQTGVMLVGDFPHTLRKIERLAEIFDVSAFAGLYMRVYSLKYVKAEDMIKELDGVVQATMFKQQGREKVSFLGLPRLNMIVALTWNEANLPFVEEWIRQLDREEPTIATAEQSENIFVYYVENGDAKSIVESLEGLFTRTEGSRSARTSGTVSGTAGTVEEKDLPVGAQLAAEEKKTSDNIIDNTMQPVGEGERPASASSVGFSGQMSGPVSFVVDATTNAILVRCVGSDYRIIKGVIEKLDIFPRQVLIEVLIAEINLDETNKLGVEWQHIFDLGGSATGTLGIDSSMGIINTSATVPIGSGLSYVIGNTERFKAALRASASENNVQILSSPHILASDNQKASIDIGSEVPVVSSQTQTTDDVTAPGRTTTQQSVQYRNTGIILNVTPHINDKGLVRMEISQEVSELSDKQVEGVSSPVFNKRKAETVLAVQDGQTIVIGGLIKKTKTDTYSGIPVLSKIPILKHLTGYQNKGWINTELMLFITAHVVTHTEDAEFISRKFLDRLEFVKSGVQ